MLLFSVFLIKFNLSLLSTYLLQVIKYLNKLNLSMIVFSKNINILSTSHLFILK